MSRSRTLAVRRLPLARPEDNTDPKRARSGDRLSVRGNDFLAHAHALSVSGLWESWLRRIDTKLSSDSSAGPPATPRLTKYFRVRMVTSFLNILLGFYFYFFPPMM